MNYFSVSFVSAGLLSLAQAIPIIMGANIGTTLTAWIMSLGYNLDRTVDVNITRLRKKLDPYARNIVSRTGFGYVFED